MDSDNNIRLALTICFLLWAATSISGVAADEAVQQPTPPEIAVEQPAAQMSKSTENNIPNKKETLASVNVPVTTKDETLESRFPYLQRALIILTIINFVAVIFASLMYLVKRRMQQFSPAPLAKLNQEA